MNVELLHEIKAHILAEPDAFRMDTWSCGTAHCIGGWGLHLKQVPMMPFGAMKDAYVAATGETFKVLLTIFDLDEEQGDALFFEDGWPVDLSERYGDTAESDRVTRAQIAAERIDRFIATNGQE